MPSSSFINLLLLRKQKLLILLLDYFALLACLIFSHFIFESKRYGIIPNETLGSYLFFLSFCFGAQFTLFYISDLYSLPRRHRALLERQGNLLLASTFLLFLGIAIYCYWTKFALGRDVLLLASGLSFFAFASIRFGGVQVLSPKYTAFIKPIKCLILGNSALIESLITQKEFQKNYLNKTIEFTQSKDIQANYLQKLVEAEEAETIILDQENLPDKLIDELIRMKFNGLQVVDSGTFYENITKRVPILHLPGNWFLSGKVFTEISNQTVLKAKRIFDLCVVLVLGLPAALVVGMSCLIIKTTSPGPAIYKQKRVGLNGKIFTVYKLRSMIVESEKSGAQWTTENDPRVTPFGRIIRATRIDELPQLLNILKGEMSLIGPRPERPEFVEKLQEEIPYYDLRHSVRPGLSGWAQINEPLATPSDSLQKLEYDLFYIRHLSFWLELDIILKTVRIVLLRKGR